MKGTAINVKEIAEPIYSYPLQCNLWGDRKHVLAVACSLLHGLASWPCPALPLYTLAWPHLPCPASPPPLNLPPYTLTGLICPALSCMQVRKRNGTEHALAVNRPVVRIVSPVEAYLDDRGSRKVILLT